MLLDFQNSQISQNLRSQIRAIQNVNYVGQLNKTKLLRSNFSFETVRPETVRIITVQRPLVAGRPIEIRCESSGAKPPALISWWRGPNRLKSATDDVTVNDENRTVSTLTFVPDMSDNGLVLACRADHAVLSDSALESTWILNVLCKSWWWC